MAVLKGGAEEPPEVITRMLGEYLAAKFRYRFDRSIRLSPSRLKHVTFEGGQLLLGRDSHVKRCSVSRDALRVQCLIIASRLSHEQTPNFPLRARLTKVSINDKDVSVVVDDSTAEANFTPAKRQPADENLADDENIEALEFSIEKRQPTDEPTATLESSRAVSAPAVTIQQPGDTTQTSSEEDNENSGDGSQESPSGELDEQGNPGVMAAPASPVVPKLSLHAEALKESFRSKRYDLGWTGEKRGTGLMRLVDIEIQKWLCAQEAKVNKPGH